MTSPVHILCTVRNPAMLDAALLVFKTLRTGFPTAPVFVWGNGLTPDVAEIFLTVSQSIGATFNNLTPTTHDAWIEQLVMNQAQPFWICDTDMVFFSDVELFCDSADLDIMAGRFEPSWHEPWTDTHHVERLHTCLMWLNPGALRGAMMRYNRQHVPEVFPEIQLPWIRQHFIPRRGEATLFYDTMAGAWHALGGRPFTAQQNEAFEHLHCGTYADALQTCEPLKDLRTLHQAIIAQPSLARGIQKQQEEFYQQRAVKATN